jgi:hypothetical protein
LWLTQFGGSNGFNHSQSRECKIPGFFFFPDALCSVTHTNSKS